MMADLVKLLSRFNRKERFFLVGQALGNKEFSLDASFREELGKEIEVKVPRDAFAAMDYHLDWIVASLWAYRKPENLDSLFPNSDQLVKGTQQDVDLLIAFESEGCYHLVFLEAKAYDSDGYASWDNDQMRKKSQRLKRIFEEDGEKHPKVKPHFCLMSPRRPRRLETEDWPAWMRRCGDQPYYWLKLKLEPHRLRVTREGSSFRIKKI